MQSAERFSRDIATGRVSPELLPPLVSAPPVRQIG